MKHWGAMVSLSIGLSAAICAHYAWSGEPNPKFLANLGAKEKCSPADWPPPATSGELGVLDLLKDMPANTTWSALPEQTKQRLQR